MRLFAYLGGMHLLTLLTIFRMVVLPVQFQDRELGTTPEQQEVLVQQAEEYFNRQFQLMLTRIPRQDSQARLE